MGAYGSRSPYGMLFLGAKPSHAETIYASLQAATEVAASTEEGTHIEASNYARALLYGGARMALQAGAAQYLEPENATDGLADLAVLYGSPEPSSGSAIDLRAAIIVKRLITRGSRAESLITILTALLGTNFVKVRRVKATEFLTNTSSPGTVGAYNDPARPHFFWKLARSIVVLNEPFTVGISAVGIDATALPTAGDILCVEPENFGQAEAITVSAVDPIARTMTATFTRSHDSGCALLTHAPVLASTQRTLLIGVTPAVTGNISLLKQTIALVNQVVRGVTEASVVTCADGLTAGPFMAGVTGCGTSPIGSVTL